MLAKTKSVRKFASRMMDSCWGLTVYGYGSAASSVENEIKETGMCQFANILRYCRAQLENNMFTTLNHTSLRKT